MLTSRRNPANCLAALLTLLATLGGFVLSGLGDHMTEKNVNDKRNWGKVVGGLAMSICPERQAYFAGDLIKLDVALKNVTHHDVQTVSAAPLQTYRRISVSFEDRRNAPKTLFGRLSLGAGPGSRSNYVLHAGEELRVRLALSRLFDFSLAGKYTIVVEKPVLQPGRPPENAPHLVSNTITLTIEDRAASREDDTDRWIFPKRDK